MSQEENQDTNPKNEDLAQDVSERSKDKTRPLASPCTIQGPTLNTSANRRIGCEPKHLLDCVRLGNKAFGKRVIHIESINKSNHISHADIISHCATNELSHWAKHLCSTPCTIQGSTPDTIQGSTPDTETASEMGYVSLDSDMFASYRETSWMHETSDSLGRVLDSKFRSDHSFRIAMIAAPRGP